MAQPSSETDELDSELEMKMTVKCEKPKFIPHSYGLLYALLPASAGKAMLLFQESSSGTMMGVVLKFQIEEE